MFPEKSQKKPGLSDFSTGVTVVRSFSPFLPISCAPAIVAVGFKEGLINIQSCRWRCRVSRPLQRLFCHYPALPALDSSAFCPAGTATRDGRVLGCPVHPRNLLPRTRRNFNCCLLFGSVYVFPDRFVALHTENQSPLVPGDLIFLNSNFSPPQSRDFHH